VSQVARDPTSVHRAVAAFEQSIQHDPSFARAHAGMADALSLLPFFAEAPIDSVAPLVRAEAERAVALDSTLGEAYASLARAHAYATEWATAERMFRKSLALDPAYPTGNMWYGSLLCSLGRIAECRSYHQRARDLDPAASITWQLLAWSTVLSGDAESALAMQARADTLSGAPAASEGLTLALLDAGRTKEALAVLSGLGTSVPRAVRVEALAKVGDTTAARAEVRRLEHAVSLNSRSSRAKRDLLRAYGVLGDTARALDLLDRTHGNQAYILAPTFALASYDVLRGLPRFHAYLERANMADQPVAGPRGGRPK
jgi:Tfp pilus assembly protein PilF